MASSLTLPDSRQLSYSLDTTPENAPIVLLANPLCAPFTAWDPVVPIINKHGFRSLRLDQPGHGDSSAPASLDTTTFDTMTDDVQHLLKTLKITKLHAWVGVSMGAAAGIVFTTKYPGVVRKLAICDTISCSPINAGIDDPFGPRVDSARKEGHMDNITQATLERWFGQEWLAANPSETNRMRGLMSRTSIDGFETCCNALRDQSFDLRPLFGKVGRSVEDVVCVVGEKDANLPQTMEVMRDEIEKGSPGKQVELRTVKNAGHVCFIDGLGQFQGIVVPFLKG